MAGQPWGVAGGEPASVVTVRGLDSASLRKVRELVRELLTGHSGVRVEDAVLVADELVSNACRHARGPGVCRLAVVNQGRHLRIEVEDASPAEEPKIRIPDHTGGRGLVLVDRLASRWGVDRHGDHKTVWAELSLGGSGSGGQAPHLAAVPPDRADPPPAQVSRMSPPPRRILDRPEG